MAKAACAKWVLEPRTGAIYYLGWGQNDCNLCLTTKHFSIFRVGAIARLTPRILGCLNLAERLVIVEFCFAQKHENELVESEKFSLYMFLSDRSNALEKFSCSGATVKVRVDFEIYPYCRKTVSSLVSKWSLNEWCLGYPEKLLPWSTRNFCAW